MARLREIIEKELDLWEEKEGSIYSNGTTPFNTFIVSLRGWLSISLYKDILSWVLCPLRNSLTSQQSGLKEINIVYK